VDCGDARLNRSPGAPQAGRLPGVGGALVSGLLAGYAIAVPVGAIAVLILGLSARTSLAVGAGAGLGAATADGLYATVAVVGGAAVADLVRPVAVPLRWIAAAALLVLAVRTVAGAWRHHRDRHRRDAGGPARAGLSTPGRAYLGLLALTLLNPATVIYFSALVLGRQAQQARSVATSLAFVVGAFAASASWQLLLATGGSVIGRALAGPRGRLGTALVSGTVIGVFAVALLIP
jgi:arginine exporter protein ArgO